MKENNPFMNFMNNNNNSNSNGLFGNFNSQSNSLFNNPTSGQTNTSLFGNTSTTNNLFSNNNNGGGTIKFGLFGTNTGNNESNNEKTKESSLFGNNLFSGSNNNNSLFGFNNKDNNNKEENKEENSRTQKDNNFNFSSSFNFQSNVNNNKSTGLFGFQSNINSSSSNTNTLFGQQPDNNNKKDNSNPFNQSSSNMVKNNTNNVFLFNNEKKENENSTENKFNLFEQNTNNTNNNNSGLFSSSKNNFGSLFGNTNFNGDNKNNQENQKSNKATNLFETKKEETQINFGIKNDKGAGLFSSTMGTMGQGLFGDNNSKNNSLFGNNNNNTLFGKNNNNNNEEKPQFGLFNNNTSPEEEKKLNKKEKEEKKIEIANNNLFSSNNNNNYNPFISNNEPNKIGFGFNDNKISTSSNNNFGNIFNSNINNKNEEAKKPKVKTNENKFLFNKEDNDNDNDNDNKNINSIFSSQNKNNEKIYTNEITTNPSLFDNNKNSFFGNAKQNEEKEENNLEIVNDSNDMDLEEENKDETLSSKSDNINNIWISDNEEIIDDDIDINKKIDYKKIEEKSKNIPNNINDLNLLIIPELSEYYFNLKKSIDNNINDNDSNITIELSNKIIEILNKKIEDFNENEEKRNELINIATIYIYFDAFILHNNDINYLMRLRDELFYKYYMPIETVIIMDKKNNEKYGISRNNIESIINNLKNIYFYLTMLDISKAKQKMMELNRLYKDILRKQKLGDKTLIFNDLFLNIEKIIKIYNDIYNLKENINSKQIISSFKMNSIFQDVKETIHNLQRDISINNNIDENIKKIFYECQKICGMFSGDINYIINEYNRSNIHLIILANIFYRFHLSDFIRGLQKCLITYKNDYDKENDIINKYITRIINNCDNNQIEIVQELKGNYPFLLRYHMIEILNQNSFLYQIENQEKYLKSEAFLLFQMLKDSKVPFKYYLNYFLFYPYYEIFSLESGNDINKLPEDPSDELKEEGYRRALDYALIYICFIFNNYNNVEELINEIDEIKNEIIEKIKNYYSNDIIYKINKLCLNKFIEKNIYKYAICYYIDNHKLENEDFLKLQIHEIRKQLCAENDLNYDYSKQFDKIIINFYIKTNHLFNFNKFKEIYDNNKAQITKEYNEYQELLKIIHNKKNNISIDNNVLFLINYIEFLLDMIKYNKDKAEKNNKSNINIMNITKKFYDNCFPLPKCPSFMWYHIIMIIKNVIDDNISLFNNDTFFDIDDNTCEQLFVWDKKLIYDLIKIEKMNNNIINYDEAQKMYENAVTFINDVTQGTYFNQNIFYTSENNY